MEDGQSDGSVPDVGSSETDSEHPEERRALHCGYYRPMSEHHACPNDSSAQRYRCRLCQVICCKEFCLARQRGVCKHCKEAWPGELEELEEERRERNREIERIIIGMRRKMAKKDAQLKEKSIELEEYMAKKPAAQDLIARVSELENIRACQEAEITKLCEAKDADPRIARFGFRSLQTAAIKIPTAKVVVRYTKQEPVTKEETGDIK